MTFLLDLSTELILLICAHVQPHDLKSLSRINRRFHRTVTPVMYESIYFWGTNETYNEERIFHNGREGELFTRERAPPGAVRCFDLLALTHSLQSSSLLRSHLRRAELTWGPGKGFYEQDGSNDGSESRTNADEDQKSILHFLNTTKDLLLESLTLSSSNLYFQVPPHTKVTSLKIRHQGHYGGSEIDVLPDIDQLHKQCCIPSLDEVFVDGWLFWSDSVADQFNRWRDLDLRRAKSAALTKLRISSFGPPGAVFEDILSWPRSLRVFHFECRPYDGYRYLMPGRLCSDDFIRSLRHCHDTLEELKIRCNSSLIGMVALTAFRHLWIN